MYLNIKKKAVIAAEQKIWRKEEAQTYNKNAFVFFFTNGEYLTENGT